MYEDNINDLFNKNYQEFKSLDQFEYCAICDICHESNSQCQRTDGDI